MMSFKKTVTFTYTTTAMVNVGLTLEMLVRYGKLRAAICEQVQQMLI